MTQAEQVLLNSIKQSLFRTEVQYPDDTDWDTILREAAMQSVVGLVANGAPDSIQKEWQNTLYQNIASYARITNAQTKLLELFKKNGIQTVILKGTAASVYYPIPSLRSLGDIDFYVLPEQVKLAKSALESKGFVCDGKNDSRHIHYEKDGITYELHHHFSYDDTSIEKYIIEGMKDADVGTVDSDLFPMLPPLANGLVLLAHMRHHLRSGLGLRQVIDWMMYCDKILNDTFWENGFRDVCESVGMTTLATVATRTCQIFLGLRKDIAWCKGANETICRRLMDSVLSSGNFGRKNEKGVHIERVATAFRSEGTFRYLQRAGERCWETYHRHHWLKPICWAYQITRYVRLGCGVRRGKKLFGDLKRSKDRAELLKELEI